MHPRTRTKGGINIVSPCRNYQFNTNPFTGEVTTLVDQITTHLRTGELTVMNDFVNPSFKKRSASGEFICSPMSKVVERQFGSTGSFQVYRYPPGYPGTYPDYPVFRNDVQINGNAGVYFTGWGNPDPVDLDLQSLVDLAATAAWAGIEPPDVQSLVSFFELPKTLSMLRNPLGLLNNQLDQLEGERKRTRFKGSLGAFISSRWLEIRYGWRPLLYEIESYAKALGGTYVINRKTARAKRSSSGQVVYNRAWNDPWGDGGTYIDTTTRTLTVRAGILYEPGRLSASNYGLSLRDLPSTAWELVPYSFVVDWFVNTADFIQGLSYYVTSPIVGSWYTISDKNVLQRQHTSSWKTGYVNKTQISGTTNRELESFTRLCGLPAPSLAVKTDGIKNVFSDLRALDLLGLISQRIR